MAKAAELTVQQGADEPLVIKGDLGDDVLVHIFKVLIGEEGAPVFETLDGAKHRLQPHSMKLIDWRRPFVIQYNPDSSL